ncbi:Uncharacterized conserved protein YeaH/YhbH [Pseudomonas syringae pv. actinidiae]|uniref:Uncharacterized conserved protein YeaH/YhbH n=1 Tax=Pseudomonas syringae pv. actinidiae TaxID=103796 RepID=A0AAN4Q6E1_PSESF|nr:Uncharacterized conserved protein YeaH/YhbH [Pseudomonas syringae pv. actinidiae]
MRDFISPERLIEFFKVRRCPVLAVLSGILDTRGREIMFFSSARQDKLSPYRPFIKISAATCRGDLTDFSCEKKLQCIRVQPLCLRRFRSFTYFTFCSIRNALITGYFSDTALPTLGLNTEAVETTYKTRQAALQANNRVCATYGVRCICASIKCSVLFVNRIFSDGNADAGKQARQPIKRLCRVL